MTFLMQLGWVASEIRPTETAASGRRQVDSSFGLRSFVVVFLTGALEFEILQGAALSGWRRTRRADGYAAFGDEAGGDARSERGSDSTRHHGGVGDDPRGPWTDQGAKYGGTVVRSDSD
jgi:hypothetical protein